MNKNKRYALIGCVLALILTVLYGSVGFALLSGVGADTAFLPFVYNFFFIALPGILVFTLIAIVKIK
jgi:hypothetical protein